MSSIIDDLLFYRLKNPHHKPFNNIEKRNQATLEDFCKKINMTSDAAFLSSDAQAHYLSNKIKIQDNQFCVRIRVDKKGRGIRVETRSLKNFLFKKIDSKQGQILLLKEISNYQCLNIKESTLYAHQGSLVMTQQTLLCLGQGMGKHTFSDFYNVVITRNLNQFNHFVSRHWDKEGHLVIGQLNHQKLDKDLLLAQILNTTTTTFGVSEESSRFQLMENLIQKKKEEVKGLKKNIIEESPLEKLGRLFQQVDDNSTTSWVRQNVEHNYASSEKKFGSCLSLAKFPGVKKIDDYIYNTVKFKVKQMMPKPINEGGSCHIFIAKANITFISSVDSTVYADNEERKQQLIAVKKLKPEYQKKLAHKLLHEKNIVEKMKGGCCYFIPKYFRAQSQLDPANTLMMELIQGDELDFFIMTRMETISLWTKICILLNLIYGLRFLASYQIVHLDVKPINVMVCKQLMTKLIDFGEAYHKDLYKEDYLPGYTFPYVAPEVFNQFGKDCSQNQPLQLTQKQDVFAFGMLMAQIVFNSKIFHFSHQKFKEVYSKKEILERYLMSPQRLSSFGDSRVVLSLVHIVIRCLDSDPQKRPKFDWIAVSLKIILTACGN